MAIHSRDLLDKHIEKNRLGFWRGLWVLVKISARFIASLGPQNWSLARIISSESKIQPTDGEPRAPERIEAKVLK